MRNLCNFINQNFILHKYLVYTTIQNIGDRKIFFKEINPFSFIQQGHITLI